MVTIDSLVTQGNNETRGANSREGNTTIKIRRRRRRSRQERKTADTVSVIDFSN